MITLAQLFADTCVPYRSRSFRPFIRSFRWQRHIADHVRANISQRRCNNRLANYIIPGEFERHTALRSSGSSLRFGHSKSGHGYHAERGDFCLIGGVVKRHNLTVFYRSLELLGGLYFDLAIYAAVEDHFGPLKTVTIMATTANVFALKGNSNEKLHKQLTEFYKS